MSINIMKKRGGETNPYVNKCATYSSSSKGHRVPHPPLNDYIDMPVQ